MEIDCNVCDLCVIFMENRRAAVPPMTEHVTADCNQQKSKSMYAVHQKNVTGLCAFWVYLSL